MRKSKDTVEILQVQIDAIRQAREKVTEKYDQEIRKLAVRLRAAGGSIKEGLAPASGQKDYLEDLAKVARASRKTHTVSTAARARIAAAQKQRWAAFRKQQELKSRSAPVKQVSRAKAKTAADKITKSHRAKKAASPQVKPASEPETTGHELEAALSEFTA